MVTELEFADAEAAAAALADALAGVLRDALAACPVASLALSGGRTPRLVLPRLAAADLAWSRVVVTLTDERWVPPDHGDSNEGQVRDLLLRGPARAAHFIGLWNGAPDPAAAVADRSAALAALSFPLDAVFSGMGPDGHVASLFPDDPGWASAPGLLHGVAARAGRAPRMSLTLAALMDSHGHHLCVAGDKRAVYDRIRRGGADDLPAAALLNQDRVPVTVYLAP
ncbi:MAG: 6-phosphogluconolactonase [Hyphomicrobiales bacterium]|nr:6-phosphogluconolactonase [Hyphomicrobiales bacterium]